jgi:hypothetical protein
MDSAAERAPVSLLVGLVRGEPWAVSLSGTVGGLPWTARPSVCLDLPGILENPLASIVQMERTTETFQIILDIRLEMIFVSRIVERVLAAGGLKIVDPCQPLGFDKIIIQTKAIDDEIIRRPFDPQAHERAVEVFQIRQQRVRDLQAAGIMVAAIQKLYHGGAAVDIAPACSVPNCNIEWRTYRREEVF